MKQFHLKTLAVLPDGCFSGLLDPTGRPFAVTIEHTFADGPPLLKNGTYHCHRDHFNRGGYDTFEIEVAGHDRVLFHIANLETELEGCVGVAESFGVLKGRTAVLDSGGGFKEFMALAVGLDEFELVVSGR